MSSTLQKTDWFDRRYKPRHNGLYEVETLYWPWPFLCAWSKKHKWDSTVKIKRWRGLTEPIDESIT
jgi:hypothetical protein